MFQPYPYQERVLEALLGEHQNIILQVPTGGGKTLAALWPFLQDRVNGDGLLPGKALYAAPMRVLTTQFQEAYRRLREEELDPTRFAELEQRYWRFGADLSSQQTGDTPEDPQLEAMIVSCTVDQLLAGALGVPYGVKHSAANINVGAICSSYLILDEPHLYPLSQEGRSYKGALTTCLELLRLLKGLTRFVFMSATLSRQLVERLSAMLEATVITVNDEKELAEINQERSRVIERSPVPLSAARVLQEHDRCSLVVCNTVQQAQEIYLELDTLLRQRGQTTQLRLLHSRFTDEDRQRQAAELSELLGKEQWHAGIYQGPDIIVVATQVVEVGLDISVQTLHTQLSPANSLLQRVGRCARFALQQGRVIVYPLPPGENDRPASTLPYDARLCASTWETLAAFEGRPMGFPEEQELIDMVHTADDLALLQRYEDHRYDLQTAITTCLRTHEREQAAGLIRDITQVQVLIHNHPDETITTEPWRWQSFGLPPGQLLGKHWERLRARQNDLDLPWMGKYPLLSPEEARTEQQDEDPRRLAPYTWQQVTNQADITNALMIALPGDLATYDRDLGLVFLDGRISLPPAWQARLDVAAQSYQSELCERRGSARDGQATGRQSYPQHIGGLADAYHYALVHELGYAMVRLEHLMGLAPGTVDHAIQLALATHDLGKLSRGWQHWARAWQKFRLEKTQWAGQDREPASDYFFAKTDYNYHDRRELTWQKELAIVRPPHACESVRAAEDLLAHSLGITSPASPNLPVLRAICYAIAHHHTPVAHEYGATSIDPRARRVVEQAIQLVRRQDSWPYDVRQMELTFSKGDLTPANISPETHAITLPDVSSTREKCLETWLAFVITRTLRLADQHADRYVSSTII